MQKKNHDSQDISGLSPSPEVATAVKQVLRPLVGLLLDNRLTYGWLTRILKVIFVEVAESEFKVDGKSQTDSRISLLTSIHRKDIRKIRGEDADDFAPPSSIFIGAKLVAIWISEARFIDQHGKPKPLNRFRNPNNLQNESFEDLVRLVNKDIRPRAVYDEWIRLGAIQLDGEGRVCLNTTSFVPAKGFDEKMFYFGKNVHDHIAAARTNVASDNPPFLERSVYYDALTDESVDELAAYSRKESIELIQKVNLKARALQRKDAAGEANKRMNFGLYFYSDDD